jgi:hypothetical protein
MNLLYLFFFTLLNKHKEGEKNNKIKSIKANLAEIIFDFVFVFVLNYLFRTSLAFTQS